MRPPEGLQGAGNTAMDWRFSFSSRIEEAFHEGGLPRVAKLSCRKLISPWIEYGSVEFFCRDLETPVPICVPDIDVSIRQADPSDIRIILEAYDGSRFEDKILKRFDHGDRCFLALDERGRGVHASWVSTRFARIAELNLCLSLVPGEAYIYDVYTRRGMRRCRIDSAIRSFTYRQLREEAYRTVFLYVRKDNLAGLRAAERWLTPVGEVSYWRSSGSGRTIFPRYDLQVPAFRDVLEKIGTPEFITPFRAQDETNREHIAPASI